MRDAIVPEDLTAFRPSVTTCSRTRRTSPSTGPGRPATTASTASSRSCRPAQPLQQDELAKGASASGRPSSRRRCSEGRRVLVRSVSRESPATRARTPVAPGRGVLGPQPRRARHHLLAALPRRRRRERLHALRPARAPRRASFRTARRRTCRATSWSATSTRRASCPCPVEARRRHLPPRQDAAHDHPQLVAALAARALAALPRGRHQGEGDHYPWKIYVNQMTGERFKP